MKIPALFCFIIVLFSSCTDKNKELPEPVPLQPVQFDLPEKAAEVIEKNNAFGIDLFREASVGDLEENLMLSPLSANVALTMLLNGCKGQTFQQIAEMLAFSGMTAEEINEVYNALLVQLLAADPNVTFSLANAVWYHDGFAVYPSYIENMTTSFDAHIEALDFSQPASLQTINTWASDNTNGKIEKVLDEISPEAVMFLMNALYFKGDWTWPFDPGLTSPGPFNLEDGSTVNVQMMRSKIPVKTLSGTDYFALELFYGRQNFSMVIILPMDPIIGFLENLTPEMWAEITANLDGISEPHTEDILFPKFSFDYEKILNDQLMGLGMTDAFDPSLADLSGIANASLYVSFVKQNTFIDVNEEGTEAAAVTTIGIEVTSLQEININKPFVFAIRERTTNTLLFIGKLMDPS